MKTYLFAFVCILLSITMRGQAVPNSKKALNGQALLNDSLYGKGRLFDKGSLMFGSTAGIMLDFITNGPIDNRLGLQFGPSINYFLLKRWSIGLNSMQYISWSTKNPPRYYWDLGFQSKYYFLNHRSITLYPFVNYMFGNFDGYVNFDQNYRRIDIYHKMRAGVGVNIRLKEAFTFNVDLGWWQFITKPKELNTSGIPYSQFGFNYVIKTRKK